MSSPSITVSQTATPAEAAAIAAAIQRFGGDTAVALPAVEVSVSPWLKAAMVEGVSAKDSFGPGDPRDLG